MTEISTGKGVEEFVEEKVAAFERRFGGFIATESKRKLQDENNEWFAQALRDAYEAGATEGAENAKALYTKEYEQGYLAGLMKARELMEDSDINHSRDCPVSHFEAGRPTEDGGYEQKFAGKWYRTRPVDETPKCTCLPTALDAEIKSHQGV